MAKPGKKPTTLGEGTLKPHAPVQIPVVDETAYVRDPLTHEITNMPKAEAALALRTGRALPASEEESEHQRYGQLLREQSTGGEAAFVGLLRGLSGRASDIAMAVTPEGRDELNAITEAHPWITGGTELAGSILPFTRLGQVGRFATFPGMADAVGSSFARALRVGEPGFTRMAMSRLSGTGLEGALYGGSAAASDAAVSDTPLTAEKFWTGVTTGAGLGAALGLPFGVLEGVGAAAGKYGDRLGIAKAARGGVIEDADIRRTASKMLNVPEGEIAPGVIDEWVARMHPEITPENAALFRRSKTARAEAFLDGERRLEALTPEVQEALENVLNVDRVLGKNWQGRIKEGHALKLIKEDRLLERDMGVQMNVRGEGGRPVSAAELDKIFEEHLGRPLPGVAASGEGASKVGVGVIEETFQGYLRNLRNRLEAASDLEPGFLGKKEGDINRAIGLIKQIEADFRLPLGERGTMGPVEASVRARQRGAKFHAYEGSAAEPVPLDPRAVENFANGAEERMARQFQTLDSLKRRLGGYGRGHGWLGQDENVARIMRSEYENLRAVLEDPKIWGQRLSGMQREINEIYHPRLFADKHFQEAFLSGKGLPDPDNAYVEWQGPSQDKIKKHFGALVSESKNEEHQMLLRHIEGTKKLGAKLKEYFALEPGEAKAVDVGMGQVDKALEKMGEASHLAMRINQGKALKQLGLLGNGIWAPIIGSALFGLPGFLAGQGIMLAINPGKYIAARAVFDKIVDQANLRVASGISGFLTGGVKKLAGAAKGAAETGGKAGKAGIAALARQGEKPRNTYTRIIAELSELPGERTALETHLREFVGRDADGLAPQLIPNMAQQAIRAKAAVFSSAPILPAFDPILGKALPLFPSAEEMDNFADTYRAATDPASILDAMQERRLTGQMVDAAERSAPMLIEQIRSLLVSVAQDDRVELGYEQKLELSILFKVPMDPTLSGDYVQAQQAMHASRVQSFLKGRQEPDRRTYGETGVNKSMLSHSDRRELAEPPR